MAREAERDPGLDRVYRASAGDEPPTRLDAAILAAARREVGARPAPLASGLRRWRVPVSLAAVVVLSVSLVTLVKEEGGGDLLQATPEVASPRPSVEPSTQPAPTPSTENDEKPRSRAATPSESAPTGAAPRDDAAGTGSAAGKAADSLTEPPAPESAQGPPAASSPAPAAQSRPESFRDSAVLSERGASGAPATGSDQGSFARKPMAAAPAPETSAEGARAQARKEAAASEVRPPVWQGYEKEPPQKWLERIEELRRQQRMGDADAMLAEFRRRFPGHPFPPAQH